MEYNHHQYTERFCSPLGHVWWLSIIGMDRPDDPCHYQIDHPCCRLINDVSAAKITMQSAIIMKKPNSANAIWC
jgi:hypothetical protein